jgi:hypothetical protein
MSMFEVGPSTGVFMWLGDWQWSDFEAESDVLPSSSIRSIFKEIYIFDNEIMRQVWFFFYIFVTNIILTNLLIAQMSSTYETVNDEADVQWKFKRSAGIKDLYHSSFLPAPLNLVNSTFYYLFKYVLGAHLSLKWMTFSTLFRKDPTAGKPDFEYEPLHVSTRRKNTVRKRKFVIGETVDVRYKNSGWYAGTVEGFEEPGEQTLLGGYVILFNGGKRIRNVLEDQIKKVKSYQIARWGIPWKERE